MAEKTSSYSSYKQGQSIAPTKSSKFYSPPPVSESDSSKKVSSFYSPPPVSESDSSKKVSSLATPSFYSPPPVSESDSSKKVSSLATPSKGISYYTKGGMTFKRTSSGVTRIDKPTRSIEIGLAKTSSGKLSVIKPLSSKNINRRGKMVTQSKYSFGGNTYFSEGGKIKSITNRRHGFSVKILYPPNVSSKRITFFDFNRQSFDPNLFSKRTILPLKNKNSQGKIWGFVDTKNKFSVGFSNPITQQDILRPANKIKPSLPLSLDAQIKLDVKNFVDTKKLNIKNLSPEIINSINKNNVAAKLSRVTRTDLKNIVLPRYLQPNTFVVMLPNAISAANYKGLDKFGVKLAKKGFAVPADIIMGFQAGIRDWKGAVVGFTAGAGIDAAARLTAKSTRSKFRLISKFIGKAAYTVAIPLLLFDLGREYRTLVADGNSPAFALTKAITTLGTTVGGAAIGTKVSAVVLSSSTRKAIGSAASKAMGNMKKPSKQTYRNIIDFLESANPVKVYSEVILQPSSLKGAKIIMRINPTTKKEIRTIVGKLESIVKFGNQHISVIRTVKPSFRVTERGLVPARFPKSTREISKAYLRAYKKLLSVSSSKFKKLSKSQVSEFEKLLKVLLKQAARSRKLDKGLMIKAKRVSATVGGKPVYQFEDIITGKNKRFFSRKSFLRAVKDQERLIRSGEVKVTKPRVAKWLNIINKNSVKPIYPKKNIGSKEKEKFVNMLLKQAARSRKLDKGLMIKAKRVSATVGGKPVYQFEDIITGKNKRFFSRKSFLRAVKDQERLIRSGEVKVTKSSVKDFFNAINNQLSTQQGKTIKFNIQRSIKIGEQNVAKVKKRITTLKDINRRTKVKTTSSGGLEIKAANGQVIILETPVTIKKNNALKRTITQRYKQKTIQKTKTIKLQQFKTKNYQLSIVKPQVLQEVKSFNQSIKLLSKILSNSTKSASVLARTLLSSSRFKKVQSKQSLVEGILQQGKVQSKALAQTQLNVQSTATVQFRRLNQYNVQSSVLLTKQVLITKAKTVFSPRTVKKLVEIDKLKKKRKKVKFSKAEIKYMLSKIYMKGRYRPSLAALIYGITSFKAPKTLTGFELRPILKKR